jgi:hypothetical protein
MNSKEEDTGVKRFTGCGTLEKCAAEVNKKCPNSYFIHDDKDESAMCLTGKPTSYKAQGTWKTYMLLNKDDDAKDAEVKRYKFGKKV